MAWNYLAFLPDVQVNGLYFFFCHGNSVVVASLRAERGSGIGSLWFSGVAREGLDKKGTKGTVIKVAGPLFRYSGSLYGSMWVAATNTISTDKQSTVRVRLSLTVVTRPGAERRPERAALGPTIRVEVESPGREFPKSGAAPWDQSGRGCD